MRYILLSLATVFLFAHLAFAKLRVITAYPYIADLIEKIGKDRIAVNALARGSRDPHHIIPRPSLIARVRRADLLVINGADLEIGWIPTLIRDSRNPSIQPGKQGFLDFSSHVKLIQVPDRVSRAQGDVHPAGNPHFNLNPEFIIILARVVEQKLCELDGGNCAYYRRNFSQFSEMWLKRIASWKKSLQPLKGIRVVQYHRSHDYFLEYFGIISIGEMIQRVKSNNVRLILQDVYHSTVPSRFVADRTGARVVILPHDVRSVKVAKDIVSLYDEIVRRLIHD
jgi:zinc/manganese transport system substrate-binding protein